MIFEFLKYVKPVWYFNLRRESGDYIFPNLEDGSYFIDSDFNTVLGQKYFASYTIVTECIPNNSNCYSNFEKVSIHDNYVFIRKTFSSFWAYYVFFMRVISLNNPVKEFSIFYQTRKIKRNYFSPINDDSFTTFSSQLVNDNPLISVIIPTLNRYKFLKEVLVDLEKQSYKNFEVVVIDQSNPFQEDFYTKYNLDINLVFQEEKALWKARNTGILLAKSDYVLFCEDDIRFDADWILNHLKCIDYFDCDISTGVFYPIGTSIPISSSFFKIAEQFSSANALIKKQVFAKVGLFDRQFEGMRAGDGEFGLRCFLNGTKSVSNPYSACTDLKASIGGLREMGSWDSFRPKSVLAPRPVPSVIYFSRKYFGNNLSILMLLNVIPFSLTPYSWKKLKMGKLISLLIFLIFFPFVLLQVVRSWIKSSKMINEGSKIKFL